MKKQNIMPTVVLCTICLAVALLLSFVNMITGPIIEAAQNAAANEALLEVLPDGKNFTELTIDDKYPPAINMGYKADGGYVFRASVTGKSAGLIIMFGISEDGKIVSSKVIADQETDSYDAKVFPSVTGANSVYKDMTYDTFEPYLVAGATLTSAAYGEAAKAALQAYIVASGGEVDIRTPEQILQDNCNTAAGTTDVKFAKWFALSTLEGVDALYVAEDGSARVYVIGEAFIGVKNGDVVNADVSDDNKTVVLAVDAVISGITLENVDIPEGTKDTVTSIKKASNGAYLFELSAKGYQAMFDWGDGTPISIMLSISAEGKIIDVRTVKHNETAGLGDACASDEYYEQYRGHVDEDIKVSSKYPSHDGTDLIPSTSTDVGIIASATYTTVGYQTAIKDAFAAFKLLTLTEGGNQ